MIDDEVCFPKNYKSWAGSTATAFVNSTCTKLAHADSDCPSLSTSSNYLRTDIERFQLDNTFFNRRSES